MYGTRDGFDENVNYVKNMYSSHKFLTLIYGDLCPDVLVGKSIRDILKKENVIYTICVLVKVNVLVDALTLVIDY